MGISADLRTAVEAWIADDPDQRDQAELRALLRSGAAGELRDRFAGRLTFGTAGLRGAVGAGPNRMNRAVVRAATAAVAWWLLDGSPGSGASVVVGCDARHRSEEFASEAAAVLAGAGITVHLLPRPCPTPLLAFAVRHLAAAAGIMITASHNPAADNGYKLYLSDGAQVIPPADAAIEARIAGLGPLASVRVADGNSPLVIQHGDEVADAYLRAVTAGVATDDGAGAGERDRAVRAPEERVRPSGGTAAAPLDVVYTPMHGVAGSLMLRAITRARFAVPPTVHVVKAQAEPDPDFPTVAFPNPEEPGALDLALADARGLGADFVLASDPDGDRLAVAVLDPGAPGPSPPGPSGQAGWRQLTGDQLGALLGAYVLRTVRGGPGASLVATTIVSSTLLSAIASAAGARYAETLTGFKWIARAGDGLAGTRFVFGYEEALGYLVGDTVRDKDGIGAALAVLALAASAKAAGRTLLDEYDDLERRHGVHLTEQLSLRIPDPAGVMRRLRAAPPTTIGGHPVRGITDYADSSGRPGSGGSGPGPGGSGPGGPGSGGPGSGGPAGSGTGLPPSDVLAFALPGARVVIRPSGTEPKVKAYLEVTQPPDADLPAARGAAAARLAPLRAAVARLLHQSQGPDR